MNRIRKQRIHRPAIASIDVCRAIYGSHYAVGKETERLEKLLASEFGFEFARTVGSGYDALKLAIEYTGKLGANIVVPSHSSCDAILRAVVATGNTPVFCKVNPETLSFDAEVLRSFRNERKADLVIAPSHMGIPCCEEIADIGVPVIEDACQAFHSRIRIRSNAMMMAISFYPTKNFNCISGGMLLCRSSVHGSGVKMPLKPATEENTRDYYRFGRMPNIHCAIGLGNFRRVESEIRSLIQIKEIYTNMISEEWLIRGQTNPETVPWRFLVDSHGLFGKRDLERVGIESDREFVQIESTALNNSLKDIYSLPYYIGMKRRVAIEVARRFNALVRRCKRRD